MRTGGNDADVTLKILPLYVSTSGTAEGDGSEANPFASIDAAFEWIRSIDYAGGNYTIILKDSFSTPLSISDSSSALPAASLALEGVEGGSVQISGNSSNPALTLDLSVPVTVKNLKFTGGSGTSNYHDGGGIYLKAGSLTLASGAVVTGNNAGTSGGGIYVEGGTLTLANGSKVSNNTAVSYGGGIFAASGSVTLEAGCEISGNSATSNGGGGVLVDGSAQFTMTGGTISGNTADGMGGGVALADEEASFSLSGGTISENTGEYGGAIYMSKGNCDISGGTISENTATEDGGAMCIEGGTCTMSNGEIRANSAKKGGAIYIGGFSPPYPSQGTFNMSGGKIQNNNHSSDATAKCKGIYVASMADSCNLSGSAYLGTNDDIFIEYDSFFKPISVDGNLSEHDTSHTIRITLDASSSEFNSRFEGQTIVTGLNGQDDKFAVYLTDGITQKSLTNGIVQ